MSTIEAALTTILDDLRRTRAEVQAQSERVELLVLDRSTAWDLDDLDS